MNPHDQRRLKFEGQALIDADGVLFAGHYEDNAGSHRTVICRLERAALIACCGLVDPTTDDLLTAYRSIRNDVQQVASAQFYGGILRPIVKLPDLQAVLPHA